MTLEEKARTRAGKMETHIIEWTPSLFISEPRVVLGTFSAASKSQRWIRPGGVVYPFSLPQTVSEVTRDWLSLSYRLPLRTRNENRADLEARIDAASMPLFALAGWRGDALYLDIAQAYRQIAAAVGWDVEYWPQRGIISTRPLKPVPAWLWNTKLWRSLLYSLSRKTPMAISRWGVIAYEQIPSPYYNPRIVALVLDVLNGVAHDLHRIGAVYCHTDGAIIPYHLAHLAHLAHLTHRIHLRGAGHAHRQRTDPRHAGNGSESGWPPRHPHRIGPTPGSTRDVTAGRSEQPHRLHHPHHRIRHGRARVGAKVRRKGAQEADRRNCE